MWIRRAKLEDARSLQELIADQMGYEADLSDVSARLEQLLQHPEHVLLVGVDRKQGILVGYGHASLYECLYAPPVFNVLGLAVKKGYQRRGLAGDLMHFLEEEAVKQGLAGIRVNSGIGRKGAHAFYTRLGYIERADQKRFFKRF